MISAGAKVECRIEIRREIQRASCEVIEPVSTTVALLLKN